MIEGSAAVLSTMSASSGEASRADANAVRVESMAASDYRVDDVVGSDVLVSRMEWVVE